VISIIPTYIMAYLMMAGEGLKWPNKRRFIDVVNVNMKWDVGLADALLVIVLMFLKERKFNEKVIIYHIGGACNAYFSSLWQG